MTDREMWDELEASALADARAERHEREAMEAEGALMHLQLRSMTRVAWDAMQQGDVIRCEWPSGSVSGTPSAAIGDLVVMMSGSATVGVFVPALTTIRVVERRASGGAVGERDVASFEAWLQLLALEPPAGPVTCLLAVGEPVVGELVVVTKDHLLVRDRQGLEVAVARGPLAAVSVPASPPSTPTWK